MSKIYTILILVLLPLLGWSQARLVLNRQAGNDPYIYMNADINGTDSVYLVLENPAVNAITLANDSEGRIISTAEKSRIKWHIGENTATYTLPYVKDNTATARPVGFTIQTKGSPDGVNGYMLFSTYETPSDNTPLPTGVHSIVEASDGTTDNSLFVVDRFYILDAVDYTDKPDVELSFQYHTTETAAPNTIDLSNLQAQRYNPDFGTNGGWQASASGSSYMWGTSNGASPAGLVSGVDIAAEDFYAVWALVDNSSPLPISLLYFRGECVEGGVDFSWASATETNNDYYLVEYSFNGIDFHPLFEVDGAGTSLSTTNYNKRVDFDWNDIAYFRLVDVDYNGKRHVNQTIAVVQCNKNDFSISVHGNGSSSPRLVINSQENLTFNAHLFDMLGRLVTNRQIVVSKGLNEYDFIRELAVGTYLLRLSNENMSIAEKVLITR
jgi:hypothetical protein